MENLFTSSSRWREYLSEEEESKIRSQFRRFQLEQQNLVFWVGIPREWAQLWADKHDMVTLTRIMGPLMSPSHPDCPKRQKSKPGWSRYIKGASALFAEYACNSGKVTLLTRAPTEVFKPRSGSTFARIEEPILKGTLGNSAVAQIVYVHPTILGAENHSYQAWPKDESQGWYRVFGVNPPVRKHFRQKESDR